MVASISVTQAILEAQECGQRTCACHASVRKGYGVTHCLAHPDQHPGMNVSEHDGKPLLRCHAGCSQADVIAAARQRGLWYSNDNTPIIPRTEPPRAPEPEPLDPDVLDRVFRALLKACPITADHRAWFEARGELDGDMAGRYGSLPANETAARAVAHELVKRFGKKTILATPGFFLRDGVPAMHCGAAGYSAAIVPGFDHKGRIIGCTRATTEDASGKRAKYETFLNTRGLHTVGGHHASVLLVTEGIHKGNVIALDGEEGLNEYGGYCVLGLNGLALTDAALATVNAIKPLIIVLAIDNDHKTNPNVAAGRQRLYEQLKAAGYCVLTAAWDDAYKGLDDALNAGGTFSVREFERDDRPPDRDPDGEAVHQQLLATRERADQAERERDELRAVNRGIRATLAADHLHTDAPVAIAAVFEIAEKTSKGEVGPDGWVRTNRLRLAEYSGAGVSTITARLKSLKARGAVEARTGKAEWVPEHVNQTTGEIVGGHYETPMFIRPTAPRADIATQLDHIVQLPPLANEPKRGGVRKSEPKSCPDHPYAEPILAYICPECSRVLEMDDVGEAAAPGAQNGSPDAETRAPSSPSLMDRTEGFQNGSPDDDQPAPHSLEPYYAERRKKIRESAARHGWPPLLGLTSERGWREAIDGAADDAALDQLARAILDDARIPSEHRDGAAVTYSYELQEQPR